MMQVAKKTGAAAGALVLAAAGMAASVPAFAGSENAPAPVDRFVQADEAVLSVTQGNQTVSADNIDGDFSFDQGVVSSNNDIARTFMRAAATMCASLPDYGASIVSNAIRISGESGASIEATVAELADNSETVETIAACACASNIQGGGAIMNAGVSGVTIESVAGLI
ncbi:MAG: hypothetical protein Q4D92_08040 [Slackia sp.]|nr:hypothetical protein [Slackia sp.]